MTLLRNCYNLRFHHLDGSSFYQRGGKAHWRIVKCYKQQLIDPRVTEQSYPKRNLFRRVLIAGFQVAIWIFWSCQHMAMSGMDQTLVVVESNEHFYLYTTYYTNLSYG